MSENIDQLKARLDEWIDNTQMPHYSVALNDLLLSCREAIEAMEKRNAELWDDFRNERSKVEAQDFEIGKFQDSVRESVIKLSGAPDERIDGKGSDASWQEFTLAEISQGFAWPKHQLAEVEAKNAELRDALQLLHDYQNGPPLPSYESKWNEAMALAKKALSTEAGKDYIHRDELNLTIELLQWIGPQVLHDFSVMRRINPELARLQALLKP